MPRLENWDEFADKAKKMVSDDPASSRIVMKYRHKDGKLKVKATDNKKVLQYFGDPKDVQNVNKLMSTAMSNTVS